MFSSHFDCNNEFLSHTLFNLTLRTSPLKNNILKIILPFSYKFIDTTSNFDKFISYHNPIEYRYFRCFINSSIYKKQSYLPWQKKNSWKKNKFDNSFLHDTLSYRQKPHPTSCFFVLHKNKTFVLFVKMLILNQW